MKVVFEFNLENVDDAEDYKLHQDVKNFSRALTEGFSEIRNYLKYREISEETRQALEKIREKMLYELEQTKSEIV